MKKFKLAFVGLSFMVLGALTFAACGDSEEACQEDSDCAPSEVCGTNSPVVGQCVVECAPGEDECAEGEQCGEAATEKWGCFEAGGGADAGPDAGGDTDGGGGGETCDPECEAGDVCQDGECVPAQNHKWVQIVDKTWEENQGNDIDDNGTDDAEEACNQDGATGSDIFGVELIDSEGETLAWGETIAVNTTATKADDTDYSDKFWSLINGEAPSLENQGDAPNACPSGFDGNVAPLGCDGSFVVGFPSEDGWWTVTEDHQIRVYEYGEQCFENCDPTSVFADCAIDYASVNVCEASASKGDIEGGMADGDGNFPGCNTESSFLGNGYTVGSPVLP